MGAKLVEMAANGRLEISQETRTALGLQESGQFSVGIRDGAIVLTPIAVVPLDRNFLITPDRGES